jgi:hypothetical protein
VSGEEAITKPPRLPRRENMEAARKPSALETLKALSQKKPAAAGSPLAAQTNDPAIAGAKRDKNTVKLGFDPGIAEDALNAATLREALERAKADFEVCQARMRDYGRDKRKLYNDTFKADVTTVCVPYSVEVPGGGDGATPGRETRFVQVICTNKYSVAQETVINNKENLGDQYDRLFTEEVTKTLKPNAEALIRDLLGELGMHGDQLQSAMDTLFDEKVKVSARESYEQDVQRAPEDVRTLLEQAVTRVQPGLKFPNI